MIKRSRVIPGSSIPAFLVTIDPPHAAERSASIYPHGIESCMAGVVPPPGVYGIVYGNRYTADQVNNNNDNNLDIPGFKLTATSITPRIAGVSSAKVLGGDLAVHGIFPFVNLKVSRAEASQSRTGLAEITTNIGAGYHYTQNLHTTMAIN